MKKIISFLLATVMAVFAVCSLASCSNQTQTVFAPDGEKKGTLKMGFDADGFEPYGYLDETTNQYAGFDIELAKAACNKIGYELQLVPISWDAKDMEIESGNIDCIWNGFTVTGRENEYAWTPAYSDSSIVVLVKGDSIQSLADLAGKSVKVQAGSSGETALYATDIDDNVLTENGQKVWGDLAKTFKDGAPALCAGYTEAFTELETGAVQALIIDKGTAEAMIANKTDYNILSEAINTEQYAIGFKKGNTALAETIWNAIMSLDKSVIKNLAQKYGIEDSISIDD